MMIGQPLSFRLRRLNKTSYSVLNNIFSKSNIIIYMFTNMNMNDIISGRRDVKKF